MSWFEAADPALLGLVAAQRVVELAITGRRLRALSAAERARMTVKGRFWPRSTRS